MAGLDAARLIEAISEAAPCGPDYEREFDMEFMGFLARSEGLLPASFATFERGAIDFEGELRIIDDFSARTRDLRLLVLRTKLLVLNRDGDGFAAMLAAIAALLRERWDSVHPQGEDGDFGLRAATVQALDDMPHVVLPLQEVPWIETRRLGAVDYRKWLLANGKAEPRPKEREKLVDAGELDRALRDAGLDVLKGRRDLFMAVAAAAHAIEEVSIDRGGYENAVKLERLATLAESIGALLDGYVGQIDPSAMLVPPEGGAPEPGAEDLGDAEPDAGGARPVRPPGVLASRAEALVALRAAGDYFRREEPSSPTLLLVQFAERLIGKPFFEVLRLMMPQYAAEAGVRVGQNAFRLGCEHLTELVGADAGEVPADGAEAMAGGDDAPAPEAPPPAPAVAAPSRRDALRLLDQVAAFLRIAEPASPVPLVLARARDFAERDFASLVKDVFSDPVLRAMSGEE